MSIQFTEKMKRQAQTRMWVKWKRLVNGYGEMIYYSFETSKSLRNQDITYGMEKLVGLAKSDRLSSMYEIAIIYNNKTGQEMMRFKNGLEISDL
ncbi:hypothetical protein [Marinoscillum sp.]|uniref:hypothetical protein n=1 Tax=Marinoscillum sp. TaxID=2024838 RepID=UPI003BAB829F